jgi:hypothetical protein
MTRLGELLEILGADRSRVVGAYLETYFRYGDTPGASVARMRLLSQRMNTMKPKEVEQAVSEIQDISSKTPLAKMPEFATLMVAEGYTRRNEYEKAIKLLAQYYQANPTTSDTEILTQRIIQNINSEIRDYVDKGDFIQALKTHNQYVDNWLKGSNRIDTVYSVGRAFEQAGVFSECEKVYRDVLKKLQAMRGTKAEKERNIL